jgi:PhoPQ-activated pathogenicity-related protein
MTQSLRRLAALLLLSAGVARADVTDYVKKPDAAFAWKLRQKLTPPQGTVYDLELVSQVWQGITWEHSLQVYVPKDVKPNSTMLLWNQGGKPGVGSIAFGLDLAARTKAPVAFLYGIPNQPLLDGKKEDALIAETFVRYLKTKDESWPLLFPMVKSLVRAMDALQAFSKEQWKEPVQGFVVTGGSKRGWTTWLTAVADPRVKAIAPLVIDTLNMVPQMEHQLASFGKYSEMIRDYTTRQLVPLPDTREARHLWSIVDPYWYRDRITCPKCIINGANDPYWTVDALNLYWDGLKGDKWVIYVPNAGHNLEQRREDGKSDRERAVSGLAAFTRSVITGKPMPRLTWKHDNQGDRLRVSVEADPAPAGGRLWVVDAPTRDFRKARWKEQPIRVEKGKAVGEVDPPSEGFRAFFAELDFEREGLRYHLCTQVRVAAPPKK